MSEKPKKKVVKKKPQRIVSDLDKLSCLSKYPVKMLNEFKVLYIPETKGWYKMNKGHKVELLKEALKNNCDDLPPVPERVYKKSQYGVKYGKVQPYNEDEQEAFMEEGYDTAHPLKQKKLDEVKHKDAYNKNIKIVLNKHQKDFVINFINSYFTGALLFHGVGSGKTLTSVVFSHYYLSLYPNNNVVIISPPSLLFNFVDAMRLFGLDVKDNRYKFETYDKFIKNYKNIVNDKTLLIIDESHIMRTHIQYGTKMEDGEETITDTIVRGKKPREIIDACNLVNKVLCMTGTAFVNRLYDIENTMTMIGQRENPMEPDQFNKVIQVPDLRYDYFKYRISYFSVFDNPELKKEFPKVNEIYVGLELKTPYKEIFQEILRQENPYNENGTYRQIETATDKGYKKVDLPPMDIYGKLGFSILQSIDKENKKDKVLSQDEQLRAFYVAQRQYGNVINGLKVKFIIEKLKENPKMKSIIYSSFMKSSLTLLRALLGKDKIKYATITGDDSITKRTKAKNEYNDPNSGVNVLIISKAGTEGVDTKNTQQFFLYEPQWNEATAEQAIARAVRFKSHASLPPKERYVNVYRLIVYMPDDKHIIDKLKSGKYEKELKYYLENEKIKDDILKEVIQKVKGSKYDFGKPIYNKWEKKFLLSYKKSEFTASTAELKEKYYKHLILDKADFSEYTNKWKKASEATNEEQNLFGTTADVILQTNSYKKQLEIMSFLNVLKKDIPKVKDFKEPFHKELLKALDNDEDPKKIIEKQQDILEKNSDKIIKLTDDLEEIIGKSISDSQAKQKKKKEKMKEPSALQEFFTPKEIADELISYSDVLKEDKYIRVLEPTSGYGALVSAVLRERTDNLFIDMCEKNPKNRKVLEQMVKLNPSQLNLFETSDYLQLEPPNDYHLIVMNPPFHLRKGAGVDKDTYDINFVIKAYEELEDGGELLAIVSGYLSHGKSQYKKWIKDKKVKIIKTYKNYKWKGEKGGKLNLNFEMIKITKPKSKKMQLAKKK